MHRARRLAAGAEGSADNSGEGAQLAEDWLRPDTTAFFTVTVCVRRTGHTRVDATQQSAGPAGLNCTLEPASRHRR
eukprot:5284581-Prymnesium_polylepis.1